MNDSGQFRLGFMVEVVEGDALEYEADVLAVKYSPRSGGLGAQVRKYLKEDATMLPSEDDYRMWSGKGIARVEYILMLGAPPPFSLRYPQLRDLGRRFLEALWREKIPVKTMVTTAHGVRTGAGLDEIEAFRSLLLGLSDAYDARTYPPSLKRIVFVEKDENRVRLMQEALPQFLPIEAPAAARKRETGTLAIMAGQQSFDEAFRQPEADEETPHVFVAMPFRDDYDDQYYLAIQPAIKEMGLLCERMDLDAFTGDIVERMLDRIRTAKLMVALLDGCNPNVYLEVGYAWGVKTQTILLARQDEALPFDVQGHRVLLYDKIYRMKEMLKAELHRLAGG